MTNTQSTTNIVVPTKWGMFTTAGDNLISKNAQKLLDGVNALVIFDEDAAQNELVKFVASWENMSATKKFSEAGDSAVRECVADFHDKVVKATFGFCDFDHWTKTRDLAWHRRVNR